MKKKLINKEILLGSWLTIDSVEVCEILSRTGFDWIALDMEHSHFSIGELKKLFAIINANGVKALVRVSKNEEVIIKQVLDAGADGIIAPMICSQQDAQDLVNFAHYMPKGKRGLGLNRAQGYNYDISAYKQKLQNDIVLIAQIEHKTAIDNLEAMMSVEDIDAFFIGPYDLSASLEVPGDFNHAIFKEALAKFKSVCQQHQRAMGFHSVSSDAASIKEKINEGYHFIGFGLDFFFLKDKLENEMKKIHQ